MCLPLAHTTKCYKGYWHRIKLMLPMLKYKKKNTLEHHFTCAIIKSKQSRLYWWNTYVFRYIMSQWFLTVCNAAISCHFKVLIIFFFRIEAYISLYPCSIMYCILFHISKCIRATNKIRMFSTALTHQVFPSHYFFVTVINRATVIFRHRNIH